MSNVNNSMFPIYKGDDTSAFGGLLMRINLRTSEPLTITKAAVSINVEDDFAGNSITKYYENPTWPLDVNLDSVETRKLRPINHAYLAVWDEFGRKRTPKGHLTFDAQGRRVED